MLKNEQREALADFLRQRRASLSPGEVGLPPGASYGERQGCAGKRSRNWLILASPGTSGWSKDGMCTLRPRCWKVWRGAQVDTQ